MLRVEYGPYQPSLETAFLARLRDLKKKDPLAPVAVVAPSRRLVARLQRLAAGEARVSCLNVHFHTFLSLALRIVEESAAPGAIASGAPVVVRDPLFYAKLVDNLLEEKAAFGGLLGGKWRPRGMASAVRSSLRDLTDAGTEPRSVLEHLREGLLGKGEETGRFAALLELHREYLERLSALEVMPPSELARKAAACAPESNLLKGFSELLYYGFYDLTGLQCDLFEAVSAHHTVTLFFPYRRGHPAFRF